MLLAAATAKTQGPRPRELVARGSLHGFYALEVCRRAPRCGSDQNLATRLPSTLADTSTSNAQIRPQ